MATQTQEQIRKPRTDLSVLVDRIQGGECADQRKIVFLLGTPMSLAGEGGVPGVQAVTHRILESMEGRVPGADAEALSYQRAFAELLRVRGPDFAKQLLMDEVLKAYDRDEYHKPRCGEDEACAQLEADELGWIVPLGTRALGRIIAEFPQHFHDVVLTTNFDPLVAIALRLAHCPTTQTVLQGDGNPAQTIVNGCHVIHLHGYWYHRNALHTVTQLQQDRPMLKAYLKDLVKKYTIVVVAYGGWDDLFMKAIREVSIEQSVDPDILWTFFRDEEQSQDDSERIRRLVPEAYDQGRVQFYFDIDCHRLFGELLKNLRSSSRPMVTRPYTSRRLVDWSTNEVRRRGILENITWIWPPGEPMQFGAPCPIEWYATRRSIVVEQVATPATWTAAETEILRHVFYYGAVTGGRHILTLFAEEAESSDSARQRGVVRVEIPWTRDSEDSLFSCRIYPTESHQLQGTAVRLSPQTPQREQLTVGNSSTAARALHVSREQALRGVWLKISAAGGVFVVKLHNDSSLTEYYVYDPRATWPGTWGIADGHLSLNLANWALETSDATLDTAALQLQQWGVFAATERNRVSKECTPFLVMHVPPVNGEG